MESLLKGRVARRVRAKTKTVSGRERNPLGQIPKNSLNVPATRAGKGGQRVKNFAKPATKTKLKRVAATTTKRIRPKTKSSTSQHAVTKKRKSTSTKMDVEVPRLPPGVEDIDGPSERNILFCSEYAPEIFEYYFVRELLMLGDSDYMKKHTDMNEFNRSTVVNWMMEIHYGLRLSNDTIFFAVNFLDRYLAKKLVKMQDIQLLGASCLALAAKYEETMYPEMRDYVFASEDAFTKEDMLNMEVELLAVLRFELSVPTTILFLRRFSNAAGSSPQLHTLCKYLIELCLIDYRMLKYNPSTQAAAAVYLARRMTKTTPVWTPTLEYYSKHSVDDLLPCARSMNELVHFARHDRKLFAFLKYHSKQFGSVSRCRPLGTL